MTYVVFVLTTIKGDRQVNSENGDRWGDRVRLWKLLSPEASPVVDSHLRQLSSSDTGDNANHFRSTNVS